MSAGGSGFTEASFTWFAGLEAHNDSAWFAEHRDAFTEHVEEPFADLLQAVTSKLATTEAALVGGPATTFRINRDVRFSTDKSPYNTYRAGLLTPSGTKAESAGLVYVRLDSAGGFLAGGLYKPSSSQLEPARQAILDEPHRFADVVAELADQGLELDRAEVVKTMPRGYAQHSGHPQAEFLRLKQYVVALPLAKQVWLDDRVGEEITAFAVAIAPLLTWVTSALGSAGSSDR